MEWHQDDGTFKRWWEDGAQHLSEEWTQFWKDWLCSLESWLLGERDELIFKCVIFELCLLPIMCSCHVVPSTKRSSQEADDRIILLDFQNTEITAPPPFFFYKVFSLRCYLTATLRGPTTCRHFVTADSKASAHGVALGKSYLVAS